MQPDGQPHPATPVNSWDPERWYITPTLAAILFHNGLPYNTGDYDPVKARRFADLMLNGDWEPRNKPLRIKHGRLSNGQHRMMAVIMSGMSGWWDVEVGVTKDYDPTSTSYYNFSAT